MPRPTPLLLALCLAPAAALAQDFVVQLVDSSNASLSRVDCESESQTNIAITWQRSVLVGDKERVFVSKSDSCGEGESELVRVLVEERTRTSVDGSTVSNPITPAELFASVTGAALCGDVAGIENSVFFCVKITNSAMANPVVEKVKVTLDSKPPATPTGVEVAPLDKGLIVRWSMPSDLLGATRYTVYVTGPEGESSKTFEGSTLREGRIEGLQNDTDYTIEVSAIDAAGATAARSNASPRSEPALGRPVAALDFWDLYRSQGGQEQGGCSGAGTSLLALLPLVFLLRRRRSGLMLAALVGAFSQPALADESFGRSPQWGSFELRTGPYTPNVDSEPGLTGTPYADMFGEETSFLWRAELNFDLFNDFGRLGVGFSAGYWRVTGSAKLEDGSSANDESTLSIIPLTPLLYYRADFFDRRWNIPLVPYGKVGYGFAKWSSKLNGEQSSDDAGVKGSGWARGFEFSLGLQFVLDSLQPSQAAALDQDFGINSTSIFFDATWVRWKGNPLHLDDAVFSGGLQLAF